MALTTRSIHTSFTAIPSSSSLSYASASSTVLGKSALAHGPSLSCGYPALPSLSYPHPNTQPSCSPAYAAQRQQYPNTRPRSAAFYHRRAPPSTSAPSYRRTHLASLALAPPTGPITYDPFSDSPEQPANPTARMSRTRKATSPGVAPPSVGTPNRTSLPSTSSYLATPREEAIKVRHSKLVAGILLNRINPVGKPMRRTVPRGEDAGPKPYVRSCLSASTTPVECY
ncbi:hypothetical protein BDV98DRAFT_42079 [Pterulicium gracile]|uniref:Uncharacterized protein n=1 Tax=Pterulicium gracile TaxID=1884261 RepID=A0A5C3R133_9AGAR|nr:hypothetical protein BDV98DRAFT_42079 [Pterula gracilis]